MNILELALQGSFLAIEIVPFKSLKSVLSVDSSDIGGNTSGCLLKPSLPCITSIFTLYEF